jgi:hypothetical protein
MSQSSEFCRHNALCCFSTSICCCCCCWYLFRYQLSPETFGYALIRWMIWWDDHGWRVGKNLKVGCRGQFEEELPRTDGIKPLNFAIGSAGTHARFEPNTSRIWVQNVSDTLSCSETVIFGANAGHRDWQRCITTAALGPLQKRSRAEHCNKVTKCSEVLSSNVLCYCWLKSKKSFWSLFRWTLKLQENLYLKLLTRLWAGRPWCDFRHCVQTSSGANPASYSMVTECFYPRCKADGSWSWPLTSIWCWG